MFDQETIVERLENGHIVRNNVPIRYLSNGTKLGYCTDDHELTNGEILYSYSIMRFQVSCKPNTGNAGNWYSWPAATAGGSKSSGNELNSICPKGWQLTVNTEINIRSWYHLIRTAYNIQDSNDSKLRSLPLSFVKSGGYTQGLLDRRAADGYYCSSTSSGSGAYYLLFRANTLLPQVSDGRQKDFGMSVRCVAR